MIKINNKICCFAGHARLPDEEEVKIKLKKEISNLIGKENVTTFYSGGKGAFDWLCAHTVDELRTNYPFIRIVFLIFIGFRVWFRNFCSSK